MRCFRLSEPFTWILRHQLDATLQEVNDDRNFSNLMRTCVWDFWTNYLAITGELGPAVWAVAFLRVAESVRLLLASKDKCVETSSSSFSRPRKRSRRRLTPVVNCKPRKAAELNSAVSYFVGWGSLYNPSLGRNVNELKTSLVNSFTGDSNESEHDDDNDGLAAQLASSDAPQTSDVTNQIISCSHVEYLQDEWQSNIVKQIANSKHICHDLFWRGRLHTHTQYCYLMEYNLALVFLAALSSASTIRSEKEAPHLQPVCKRGMLTLISIHDFCKGKHFPYLNAQNLISSSPFAFCDNYLFKLFQRRNPPRLLLMSHITARLAHMLALRHLPLIPLAWLVHRWLAILAFPFEAHMVANRLIRRLDESVRTTFPRQDFSYHLPMKRYFRGEVFAMAVVAVIARLIFKLDDDFEYRWSLVAEFFENKATINEALRRKLPRHLPASKMSVFVWSKWAAWLEKKFTGSTDNMSQTSGAIGPPLHTAHTINNLVAVNSASKFFGSAEFDSNVDIGFSERNDTIGNGFTHKVKGDLSNSLHELLSDYKTSRPASSDGEYSSTSCPLCARFSLESIFDASKFQTCAEFSHSTCELVSGVFNSVGDESDEISALQIMQDINKEYLLSKSHIFRNWSYLINKFGCYKTITDLNFSVVPLNSGNRPYTELPSSVGRFLDEHDSKLFSLFSGMATKKRSDSLNTDDNSQVSTQRPFTEQTDNAATHQEHASEGLRWFLNLVSQVCGAQLTELIVEIDLIEAIMLQSRSNLSYRGTSHLSNVSFLTHLDYSIN